MLMLGLFFFSSIPLIIEQAVHGLQQIIRLSVCARLARQLRHFGSQWLSGAIFTMAGQQRDSQGHHVDCTATKCCGV